MNLPNSSESLSVSAGSVAGVSLSAVRCEHRRSPLGLGVAAPRLSWIIQSSSLGWLQTAYEIESYDAGESLRATSGRIESDQSVLVPWPFAPLSSRERALVRVRVWGNDGMVSPWSTLTSVEAGLLHQGDWIAHFISPDWDEDITRPQPCPLLRRELTAYAADALVLYAQVRPGITGLWQVSGRSHTSFEARAGYDSWYVRNWSLWVDWVILLKTVRVVLSGRGAM